MMTARVQPGPFPSPTPARARELAHQLATTRSGEPAVLWPDETRVVVAALRAYAALLSPGWEGEEMAHAWPLRTAERARQEGRRA